MMKNKALTFGLISAMLGGCVLAPINASAVSNDDISEEWVTQLIGSGEDRYDSVIETKDGGYLAVGRGKSSNIPGITNKGEEDAILTKYDQNGNQEWIKNFGGSSYDGFTSAVQTEDGGYVVVGASISKDIPGITNIGAQDSIIIKLDKNGEQEWINNFGGSEYDYCNYIIQTKECDFIAVGITETYAGEDAIIVKYNQNGTQEWVKTLGASGLNEFSSVSQTPDSGFITVGYSNSTTIDGITNKGGRDAIIVKYDNDGNQEWIKNFGGSREDYLHSVKVTKDGGFVAVGDLSSNDVDSVPNSSLSKAYMIKYDESGNQEWAKGFGGNGTNLFNSIYETQDGGYVAVGHSESTNIEGLTNKGKYDGVIVRYDKSGNQEWFKSFGTSEADKFKSVIQAKDGSFVVVGEANKNAIILKYKEPSKKLSVSEDLNITVVADNTLEMALSTNQITFDGYNGTEDFTNDELNVTVSSGLNYDLSTTMMDEFKGTADTSAILPKENFSVKNSADTEYKEFANIGEKVFLVTNATHGKDKVHNINFKLKGDSSVKADTYNTTLKFEAIQK